MTYRAVTRLNGDAMQLKRFQERVIREVGQFLELLASERAAYITGVIAQIDGGLYRGIF